MLKQDPNDSWRARHETACRARALAYTDPETGYRVFTAYGLKSRGRCCGSGCRHCPFGHERVDTHLRSKITREPWLEGPPLSNEPVTLVFWSGGKDALLALNRVLREGATNVVLVNTFDGRTELVVHQDVTVEVIRRQAAALKRPLLLVPLYNEHDYAHYLRVACGVIERITSIARLVFGDLNLLHVRRWRESTFEYLTSTGDTAVDFPLWNVPYPKLLDELEALDVRCSISAVTDERLESVIEVGIAFGRRLVSRIPQGVDAFGECGAFHTVVDARDLSAIG